MVPESTLSLGTRRSGTLERKRRALSAGAALRLSITIPGLPGCVFPAHNSKFKQEETKPELYRLIWKLYSVLIFENRCISCLKSENRINS